MAKNKVEFTIEDRFRKVVSDHLGVDLSKVTDDAKFMDDLGADSLDGVELVMAAEDEFSIEIPDGDAPEMKKTVGEAITYLKSRDVK